MKAAGKHRSSWHRMGNDDPFITYYDRVPRPLASEALPARGLSGAGIIPASSTSGLAVQGCALR
jgi:hypothetical protein